MTKAEAKGAAALLRSILALLLPMATERSGDLAADLRRACGALDAEAEAKTQAGTFGTDMGACFAAAGDAGASVAALDRVGKFIASSVALIQGAPARAVAVAALRFALIQQARAVAATDFTSRDDVEKVQTILNAAFDAISEHAADARDQEAFRAITTLHATVTRDLQQRSRPLPRMVSYNLTSMPSLVLANRLFGDAGRADELRAENRSPHPLFMPPTGRAKST